jgi:hypothetical protein
MSSNGPFPTINGAACHLALYKQQISAQRGLTVLPLTEVWKIPRVKNVFALGDPRPPHTVIPKPFRTEGDSEWKAIPNGPMVVQIHF